MLHSVHCSVGFSVPPDLASRGLNGQVVATRMLDNLSALQTRSTSLRAPSSIANNWGDNLKVEIPETGVSIGEFNRCPRDPDFPQPASVTPIGGNELARTKQELK